MNWTLRSIARNLVESAGKGEGTSGSSYVSSLVESSARRWKQALAFLTCAWTKGDVRRAVLVLVESPPEDFCPRPRVAVRARGVEVASDAHAAALLVLVSEVLCGNDEVRRTLG